MSTARCPEGEPGFLFVAPVPGDWLVMIGHQVGVQAGDLTSWVLEPGNARRLAHLLCTLASPHDQGLWDLSLDDLLDDPWSVPAFEVSESGARPTRLTLAQVRHPRSVMVGDSARVRGLLTGCRSRRGHADRSCRRRGDPARRLTPPGPVRSGHPESVREGHLKRPVADGAR